MAKKERRDLHGIAGTAYMNIEGSYTGFGSDTVEKKVLGELVLQSRKKFEKMRLWGIFEETVFKMAEIREIRLTDA